MPAAPAGDGAVAHAAQAKASPMAASCRNRTTGIVDRRTPRTPVRGAGSAGGDDDDVLERGTIGLERVAACRRRVEVKRLAVTLSQHGFVEGRRHTATR